MRFGPLWYHRDFRRLWAAQTVSKTGSQITILGLPLLAATVLHATPWQMGVLLAAEFAPALLLGLLAGVMVDRCPRRRILVAADLGRAILLLFVPMAAWLGILEIEALYAVAFLTGTLTLCFEVADQSLLPSLIDRDRLVEANGKLETSRSIAEVAGPGLAGLLIQLLTAPIAILLDAMSFLLFALFLRQITSVEPEITTEPTSLRRDIIEGLRFVVTTPVLRAIAGCAGLANLTYGVMMAVLVLYATQDLGFTAGLLGLAFAGGGIGAVIGAVLADRISAQWGVGPSVIAGQVLSVAGTVALVVAGGPVVLALIVLLIGQFLGGLGGVVAQVNQMGLRQSVTPDALQGRMNATMHVLITGAVPIGALAGGMLGEAIGLRSTLAVAVLGDVAALVWLWCSALRTASVVQDVPSHTDLELSLAMDA